MSSDRSPPSATTTRWWCWCRASSPTPMMWPPDLVTTQFPIHGGRANESRLTVDGLNVGNPPGGNQPPTYVADVGNAQEVTFTTSGGLGESETAGLVMNIVPKTGGNRYRAPSSSAAPASTFSPATTPTSCTPPDCTGDADQQGLRPQWRVRRPDQERPGVVLHQRPHPGQHANHRESVRQRERGRPDEVDLCAGLEPARFSDRTWENISARVTWQATPRNKVGGFWDEQSVCRTCEGTSTGIADPGADCRPRPTASAHVQTAARHAGHVVVAVHEPAAVRRRLRRTYYGWGNFEREANPTRDLIRVRNSAPAAAPTTAVSRVSSTDRRTGTTTTLARTRGARRRPMSPARTA